MEAAVAREADLALARRAAAGERDAQRTLFVAQRATVHHALYRILGSNHELEDLTQDAFLAIFRALGSFRGDSSLARWCQTIAMRTAFAYIERRKPPSIDLALVEDELASDEDTRRVVQLREATRRLYAALDRIEIKQRVAFALTVIDGRSLAEVAQITESSVIAVKTRVWRARKQLARRAPKDDVLASYLAEFEGGQR